MSDLTALIERLEKATEPDRELDLAILNSVSPKPWVWLDPDQETVTSNRYGEGAAGNPIASLERFTESLDDALCLVPCGWAWFVEWIGTPFSEGMARLWIPSHRTRNLSVESIQREAKTPAIALCIAAILARSPTPTDSEGR